MPIRVTMEMQERMDYEARRYQDFTYMQKIGSKALADMLKQPMVIVRMYFDTDEPSWWQRLECQEEGDVPLYFAVYGKMPGTFFGDEFVDIYPGRVLVRNGQVYFYDRYPYGGGPFKVEDFTDVEFRQTATSIKQDIDRLLGYENNAAAVQGMQQLAQRTRRLPG